MQGYENPDKSCGGVTLSVQGRVPTDNMRLAAGSYLRLLLLLAGANPEKGKQAGWLLEIGSGGKQVIHTSETNAVHCLLQLNIHRSQSRDMHTATDRRREPGRERDGERADGGNRKLDKKRKTQLAGNGVQEREERGRRKLE